MNKYECKSYIEMLDGPELRICVNHGLIIPENASSLAEVFTDFDSENTIPGTLVPATSVFTTKPQEAMPTMIKSIKRMSPYALPQIVMDLNNYKKRKRLEREEIALVEYTIRGIGEIIAKKG
jgi:hypothetical protein